jgi:Ca2+-binding EF-hand superfamily protein
LVKNQPIKMSTKQKEQFAKCFAEFDGKITREELKVIQDKYITFDQNDDGHIDLQGRELQTSH